MIADTSRAARRAAEESGAITAGCRRIMVWFHGEPAGADYTRAEIARATGIPLQTICARIRDILDDPRPFLEELAARPCGVTGNSSHPLRIAQLKSHEKGHGSAPLSASHNSGGGAVTPAAGPAESMVYDDKGKPFYVAVGYGPGWPLDQDHLHKRRAA